VPAHADSYLDQLNAELERVEKIDSSTTSAAKEERVRAGEGFSDGLSMEDFAQEMRTRHPGGNVLYIRLTRMEKVRVYEEYYLKGENYQIVVDVMAKWLAAR
jgi:small nuclear ribonucleoprotein (snRNP)-like protein